MSKGMREKYRDFYQWPKSFFSKNWRITDSLLDYEYEILKIFVGKEVDAYSVL